MCVYAKKKNMWSTIIWGLLVSTEADGLAETDHKSSGIIR